MYAVCSETLETEFVIYHFQPQYRKAALEYLQARPKLNEHNPAPLR
jgi:hypothetical protein